MLGAMTPGSMTAGAPASGALAAAARDGAATGWPWLVLGIVLGLLIAGVCAWAAVGARRPRPSPEPAPPPPPDGWAADDLPGFLEHPPGVATDSARTAGTA